MPAVQDRFQCQDANRERERRARLFEQARAGYAALKADRDAWASEQALRQELEGSLEDHLSDEEKQFTASDE